MQRYQSNTRNQVSHARYGVLLAFLGALLGVLMWGGQVAQAGESERVGRVEAMPAGTLIGTWRIAGTAYVTNGSTEFRQEKGSFGIGVCVEVEYVGGSEPFTATKIASKSADDCTGNSGTPTGTVTGSPTGTRTPNASETPGATPDVTPDVTPSGTADPGGEREVYGRVDSMPSGSFIGTWVVNGVSYSTSGSTEFKQRNGPLVVGACVKIHYNAGSSPFSVRELETERTNRCTGSSATPVSTPSVTSTATPAGEREIYGIVDSLPSGLVGTWVINGVSYTTTNSTEFEQDHGAFAVGACVKLHVGSSGSPATIREMETEQTYRCDGSSGGSDDDGSGEGELYGVLQSFPAGLVGSWNIGGMTFVADGSTEFKQRDGAFAVGVTVKVHFRTDGSGTNLAREIETRFANDDNGSDDDGNGTFEGAEGHAYGTIDSFPSGLTGNWQISGIAYSANGNTTFSQSDGNFANGKQVKVEYHLDGDGGRVARKIETTSDNGGATAPTRFKLFGYVDLMPANGFVGAWVVDSFAFATNANTQFKENNGLFGLGAYVAVEYAVSGGSITVHEIETHVPPGAGPNVTIGRLDDKGGALHAAGIQQDSTWTIDGTTYTVTPATSFNAVQGEVAVGKTVLVNSYPAADGSLVATQIRGVTLTDVIYLPAVAR